MTPNSITLKVDVLYPNNVTLKMALGGLLAWPFGNNRYLLKFGWKITIKDYEVNEF